MNVLKSTRMALAEGAAGFMARYVDLPARAHEVLPGRVLSAAQTMAFGEFLHAVRNSYATSGSQHPSLIQATLGVSSDLGESGGFLVEPQIADTLLSRTYELSMIAGRARRLPLAAGKRGIKINALKDNNRTTGARWGGVTGYWLPEGEQMTPSRPKFRQMELKTRRLVGLLYATSELVADAVTLGAVIAEAFPVEFAFLTDDAVFEGDGAATPLGFMNSSGKIVIEKEGGQAAGTIQFENVNKMFARLPVHSIPEAEWWASQDAMPQIEGLHKVIGDGGIPIYTPAAAATGSRYGTLFGLPVKPIEYANPLGQEGDLSLADPSAYLLTDRSEFASSIHVAFNTDDQAFRFIYAVDGQPIDGKPMTPFKGNTLQSTFITLADRA